MYKFSNSRVSFAEAIDTVFHETRHAIQYEEITTNSNFSYDDLIMAIDWLMTDLGGAAYYQNNYVEISYEMDAREIAYVETMKMFKQYPKIQEEYKKNYIEITNPLSKYMRKEEFLSLESYYGVIDNFLNMINGLLCDGTTKDQEYFDYIFKKIDRFPVFKEFFDIDREKRTVNPKPKSYFRDKITEAYGFTDPLKKREYAYSIQAFRYAKRLAEYLKDRVYEAPVVNELYNKEIVEEAISHVGKPPSR